jgi:hypothetical protein
LEKKDADRVLLELHDGPIGGQFGGDTTTQKILRVSYYRPTLSKDSHSYAIKCQECQRSAGKEISLLFPYNLSQLNNNFNNGTWM